MELQNNHYKLLKEGDYFDDDDIYLYTKKIDNSKNTCIVCMVDEFEKDESKMWNRYELSCGHQMHTRCFRHWCCSKGKINCAYCGDVLCEKKNMYCDVCCVFGHESPENELEIFDCKCCNNLIEECICNKYVYLGNLIEKLKNSNYETECYLKYTLAKWKQIF